MLRDIAIPLILFFLYLCISIAEKDGFHYDIYINVQIMWFADTPHWLLHFPFSLMLIPFSFPNCLPTAFMSILKIQMLHMREKKHDVCLCEPGLFHLTWWFLVSYVFWQMKIFCSLWILLHYVYIPHFCRQFNVDVCISLVYNLAVVLTATVNMDSQVSLFQNTLI
jgi:hypothetical protein